MEDLVRLLKYPFGEVLLFFNYDGVNRLSGGAEKGTHNTEILSKLLGSYDAVTHLIDTLRPVDDPKKRERVIRDQFLRELIDQSGVKYVMPFRFQARGRERTSHYIVHTCNHWLGFKIMKDVMWETGKAPGDLYGRLEFLDRGDADSQLDLFERLDIEQRKGKILEQLRKGACKVSNFTRDWVCRPNDAFSDREYRKLLIDLEQKGKIRVYDKENRSPAPADKRRKKAGAPTLGDDYWLRLA